MTEQELEEARTFREEMIEQKIALAKKNGSWEGVDVDDFMKQFRDE